MRTSEDNVLRCRRAPRIDSESYLQESLTGNPLAPTPSQFALPAEVTNILGLPQRANPTIVRASH